MSLLVLLVGATPPLSVSFESAVSIPEGTTADVCLTTTGTAPGTIQISLGATDQSASNYTVPYKVSILIVFSVSACLALFKLCMHRFIN